MRWRLPGTQRKRVLDEMSPEQMVGIRLFGFAKEALGVLETWVGNTRPADVASKGAVFSTACLAYAYLALMLRPDPPQSWLRRLILTEYPALAKWFSQMGGRFDAATADLPVVEHKAAVRSIAARFLHDAVQAVPEMGDFYLREWRRRTGKGVRGLDRRAGVLISGLLFAGTLLGGGYQLYQTLQPFGRVTNVWQARRHRPGLNKFGELGSMLDLSLGLGQGLQEPSQHEARSAVSSIAV
jgi:sorting and assembly machinery component 37